MPRDAKTCYDLGRWYQRSGDLESASRWYAQAPQSDTANPRWIFECANTQNVGQNERSFGLSIKKTLLATGLRVYKNTSTSRIKNSSQCQKPTNPRHRKYLVKITRSPNATSSIKGVATALSKSMPARKRKHLKHFTRCQLLAKR